MLVCMATLALAILVYFVNSDFVVPASHGEEIGSIRRRREGQVGNTIGGRVAQRDVGLEVAESGRRRRRGSGAEESGHDYA